MGGSSLAWGDGSILQETGCLAGVVVVEISEKGTILLVRESTPLLGWRKRLIGRSYYIGGEGSTMPGTVCGRLARLAYGLLLGFER